MASTSSKHWRDPTDYWNLKHFKYNTYRTKEGFPILRAYTGAIPKKLIQANIDAGKCPECCPQCGYVEPLIKPTPLKKRDGFAHFYLDDYQFERFWNLPIRYVKYLQTFDGALSPDYSVYSDYHPIYQKLNVLRNRELGAYWASKGIPVIPSISWSTPESFQFCFDGVEKGSILAISTVGALRTKELKTMLIVGYTEMISRLEPCSVIIYGRYPKELDEFGVKNIRIPSFHEKFESEERDITF